MNVSRIIFHRPVTAEAIKNLALAGIGKLSLFGQFDDIHCPLLGDCKKLSEFAKDLNPNLKVYHA